MVSLQVFSKISRGFGELFGNHKEAVRTDKPNILNVVPNSFEPAKFLGPGWKIRRGQPGPTRVSIPDTDLVTLLGPSEVWVRGEECVRRSNAMGNTRLGVDAFLAFWNNPHLHPPNWYEMVEEQERRVIFDRDLLEDPEGELNVLLLHCATDGSCEWGALPLKWKWSSGDQSVVLKSTMM